MCALIKMKIINFFIIIIILKYNIIIIITFSNSYKNMQNIKTSRSILMKQINNRASANPSSSGYQTTVSSINTINTTILSNFSMKYHTKITGGHVYKNVTNPITNNPLTTAELVSILNKYNIEYKINGSNWFIITNGGSANYAMGGVRTVEYDAYFSSIDDALKGVSTIKLQKCNQQYCDYYSFMITIENWSQLISSITISDGQIPSNFPVYWAPPGIFPIVVNVLDVDPTKLTSIRFV